MVATQGKKLSR